MPGSSDRDTPPRRTSKTPWLFAAASPVCLRSGRAKSSRAKRAAVHCGQGSRTIFPFSCQVSLESGLVLSRLRSGVRQRAFSRYRGHVILSADVLGFGYRVGVPPLEALQLLEAEQR